MVHAVLSENNVAEGQDIQTVCGENLKFDKPEKLSTRDDYCPKCENYVMAHPNHDDKKYYLTRDVPPEIVTTARQSARVEELRK